MVTFDTTKLNRQSAHMRNLCIGASFRESGLVYIKVQTDEQASKKGLCRAVSLATGQMNYIPEELEVELVNLHIEVSPAK